MQIPFVGQTLRPAAYHGHGKKPPFFEGWYFKVVDASERWRYAIIPGVFLGADSSKSHSFVQVLDGATGQATYHPYPLGDFRAAADSFDIQVGPNHFTAEQLSVEIEDQQRSLRGELRCAPVTPWPVTLTSPGIMGWYAWMPFMECYHGVVSLDHGLEGTLVVDGQAIDFAGGRGYTEKDWGQAFPAAWVWLQTNHFAEPGTSLTASVAIIPWIRRSFPGFIAGLWHGGRLYRFATYTGARLEHLSITDEQVSWVVSDRHYRLEMTATRAAGGSLRAPSTVEMGRRIAETLNATVDVRLHEIAGSTSRLIFSGAGRHAALEAGGDLDRLLSMHR
jgi:tocopherol cyclase